jgi:hypothetical protein
VTWNGEGSGDISGVFARWFDPGGNPVGGDFLVNSFTGQSQGAATVSASGSGTFVVAWQSTLQDSSTDGVYAQRYVVDPLQVDSFESMTLAGWSPGSQTDGGDLSVTSAAGMKGTGYGLQAVADDTNPIFALHDTLADETRYRARFWFDPNSFDPGVAESHRRIRIFLGMSDTLRVVTLVCQLAVTGEYRLRGRIRNDTGARDNTPFVVITDEPHLVEFEWRRSDPGASNGSFELWIDGQSVTRLDALDNEDEGLTRARIGVMSPKVGINGTLFFDEFESWRPPGATMIRPE